MNGSIVIVKILCKLCASRNGDDKEHYHLYSKMPWGRKAEGHSETSKPCWEMSRLQSQRLLPIGGHVYNLYVVSSQQGPFPPGASPSQKEAEHPNPMRPQYADSVVPTASSHPEATLGKIGPTSVAGFRLPQSS